jgi:hypothetical protein
MVVKKTIRRKKNVKRKDRIKRVTRKKYYKNNLGGKGALLSLFREKKMTSVELLKDEFKNVWINKECSPKLYDAINEYLRLCIWILKNDTVNEEQADMFESNLMEVSFSISIMSFEFYTNKQYNKCEIVENTKETMRELVDVLRARGRSIPWRYNDEDGWIIKQNIVKL